MYEVFEAQINKIIDNTKKKLEAMLPKEGEKKPKAENIEGKVAMFTAMAEAFKEYVKNEAAVNPDFEVALAQDWKSATRMMKFVSDKAKEIQVEGMCFVKDDECYDWINTYYFLDDKKIVEQELKAEEEKRIKAEQEKAKEKERNDKAAAMALELLQAEEGFDALSEEEKAKKLKDKTRECLSKIRAAESRKAAAEKKKAAKESTKGKDTSAKKEEVFVPDEVTDSDDDDFPWDETSDTVASPSTEPIKAESNADTDSDDDDDDELPWETASEPVVSNVSETKHEEPKETPKASPNPNPNVFKPLKLDDIDGQLSLFDFFTIGG